MSIFCVPNNVNKFLMLPSMHKLLSNPKYDDLVPLVKYIYTADHGLLRINTRKFPHERKLRSFTKLLRKRLRASRK